MCVFKVVCLMICVKECSLGKILFQLYFGSWLFKELAQNSIYGTKREVIFFEDVGPKGMWLQISRNKSSRDRRLFFIRDAKPLQGCLFAVSNTVDSCSWTLSCKVYVGAFVWALYLFLLFSFRQYASPPLYVWS